MGPPGYTVLAVDDDAVNRLMLSALVEQEGYAVRTAADGIEALRELYAGDVDAVLLDLLMPGLDGAAVLQSIKRDRQLEHIPVIMVSAPEHHESVLRCIELGAEGYVPKPFDPALLRTRLAACLAGKPADRESA